MTGRSTALEELQQWMLEAITGANEPDRALLSELVLPGARQTSAERLAVYRHAYIARLLGVLRDLFPCTRFAVGDELFEGLCVSYLRTHPPESYTLGRLADRFAEYLDFTRPTDWGAFVVELVRLEQAIDRVFDAPGPERLPRLILKGDLSGSTRLTLVPGCELLSFAHPVSTYYSGWKAGRAAAWPDASDQFVALLRRDYVVRRYELTRVQHRLLAELQGGACLEGALGVAMTLSNVTIDDLAASVRQWFHEWASERFFAAVG